ncbi:MAG TPA: TonB-dependent receptor [Prolixibacteraceae bacterium]|nr:TonB-dependent receptor [Prolixibacteraceae bacterium]
MKLTSFLILVTLMQVTASVYSQSTLLSLSMKNASLKEVFREIEKQSEFTFLYNDAKINVNKEVNVDFQSVKVEDILNKVLNGTGIAFEVIDKQVVLSGKDQLTSAVEAAQQQAQKITGKVTDQTGVSLPGVSIVVKGTSTGVVTDNNGNYSLSNIPENSTLQFSFVGMKSQEIAVGSKTTINVTLAEVTTAIDEVVAIGYGKQKKVTMTGSVATLNQKSLIEAAPTNITNALAGRLPGLIVVTGNGQPGQSSRLSIRGASTFGDNTALVVVDGIVRDFDQIDPNEIEAISILKDASATAVYGSRAANGVLLITTKRGSSGKPTFNYNGFTGMQQPTEYPRMMTAFEYAKTMNEALKNTGRPLRYTDQQLSDFESGATPGTDWYGLTMRKNLSMQTQHNINVNGGTDAIKYFASLGYLDQDGMYDLINFKRYSIRSNVDAKINPNLVISLDLDASIRQNNGSGWSPYQIFADMISAAPVDPAYNPDGSVNYSASDPQDEIKTGYTKNNTNLWRTTLSFKQELPFIKGLSLSGKGSFGKQYSNNKNYMEPVVSYHGSYSGSAAYWGGYNSKIGLRNSFSEYNTTQYSINLNFNRTFGEHEVTGLMLFEKFDATGSSFNAFRTNFPASGLDQLFFGGQLEKDATGSEFNDGRLSYVGRGNYTYKKRYLFEASFRIDGSVAFPTTKKYGFFPAFSAGWRISEESFVKNNPGLDFIDEFKMRASYGEVGSDRNVYSGTTPTFQYLQGYNMSGSLISGNNVLSSISPGILPNPNITWESAAITNIGFDGSFWKNKFQFEMDLFYKRTSNILLSRIRSIPATLGASLPAENYAVVDNRGIEVSLTHNNNIGAFKFFVKVNGGFSKNKVITLDEPANVPDYLLQTGRPLGFIQGYKSIGFFQTDAEVASYMKQFNGGQKAGDVKYADINGDGKVDSNDQTIISMDNSTPKITGGLNLGGSYHDFDFNVLFQGAAKVFLLYNRSARNFFVNSAENNFAALLDYWTPENPNAAYPRPWINSNSNNSLTSNLYLRDASYVRLKSVDIGYTLPKIFLDRIHVQKIRVYVSGTNLLKLDKGLIFDPETENGEGSYYPQQRTYNIGINLTL